MLLLESIRLGYHLRHGNIDAISELPEEGDITIQLFRLGNMLHSFQCQIFDEERTGILDQLVDNPSRKYHYLVHCRSLVYELGVTHFTQLSIGSSKGCPSGRGPSLPV